MSLKVRPLLLAALGALLISTVLFAQAPGKHPAYLHALSDLRMARAYLTSQPGSPAATNDAQMAVQQIDKAIEELKKAAIDDGKNLNDHPPVDSHLERTGRYHKALELLDTAHADVSREEDTPNLHGLQARIMEHIDAAHRYVDHAIAHNQ